MRWLLVLLCMVSTFVLWGSCKRKDQDGPLGPTQGIPVVIRHVSHGHVRFITNEQEIREWVRAISDATYIDDKDYPYDAVREVVTAWWDGAQDGFVVWRSVGYVDMYGCYDGGHFRSKALYELLTAADEGRVPSKGSDAESDMP